MTFFDEQNAKISSGALKGELINVSALMINKYALPLSPTSPAPDASVAHSGWYDPLIQNQAYVDFATNAPGYGQLQSDAVLAALNQSYFEAGGCRDQELACYAAGESAQSNQVCRQADNFCVRPLHLGAAICPLHTQLTTDASRGSVWVRRSRTCSCPRWATATRTTSGRTRRRRTRSRPSST